jgi:hypothetical protein
MPPASPPEPQAQPERRLLQREHVRPLAASPPDEQVAITAEHFYRKWRQLTLAELETYNTLHAAGRVSDIEQLARFNAAVLLHEERTPRLLDTLVETGIVCRRFLPLAHDWTIMCYEPAPVIDDGKASRETQQDDASCRYRRIVLEALREAKAVCSVNELLPFCAENPLSLYHARRALAGLLADGLVARREVEVTPRRHVTCYVPADDEAISDDKCAAPM